MAPVVELDWELEHMDFVTAFLNGDLQETVYVTQSEGFEYKQFPHRVCNLKKALYGLKQSPKSWYDKIDQFLKECGFLMQNLIHIFTSYMIKTDAFCWPCTSMI